MKYLLFFLIILLDVSNCLAQQKTMFSFSVSNKNGETLKIHVYTSRKTIVCSNFKDFKYNKIEGKNINSKQYLYFYDAENPLDYWSICNDGSIEYKWTASLMAVSLGVSGRNISSFSVNRQFKTQYNNNFNALWAAIKNNSKSLNSTLTTNEAPLSRISADIEDVSILHDQSLEEGIGMTIKMKLSVQGMKDKRIKVVAFFEDEYGNDIPCSNGSYSTTNNTLCAKNSSVANYENSVWNNFRVSVPYSMMNLKNGSNTIKFFLSVRDTKEGNTLFSTKYFTTTFNYDSSANDDCGKWPSMTSTTNGEYSPYRIKTYIEQPLGLTYGGSYQDCLRVINGYSGTTPYLNTNRQIQVTKEGHWGVWFYGIAPIANVFFVNNGSTISYYNYIFPFPQSVYSLNEVKDFCRFMKQCASQYGYNLSEQSSSYYKASGYGNGKTVSIEMGTLDGSRYGVELKIVP